MQWRVKSFNNRVVVLDLLVDGLHEPTAPDSAVPSYSAMSQALEQMVHIVESKNPGLLWSILLVDSMREHMTVGADPSLPAHYNQAVEGLRLGPAVGSCGTAAFWNIPVVVEDIASDPLWEALCEPARQAGVAACWSHPISNTSREILGAIALYWCEPKTPTQLQMDRLEIAARMAALAIGRERLQDQVRQAGKLEALGGLDAGIAHDFNNLLSTILDNVELARLVFADGNDPTPKLPEIMTASTNAAELCAQMLVYVGHQVTKPTAVECNALVEELGGLLQVAMSKKATLAYELSDEPLTVWADRSQLRLVVMNLITNAADAVGDNAVQVVVSTSTKSYLAQELRSEFLGCNVVAAYYTVLRVSDVGAGMPPLRNEECSIRFYDKISRARVRSSGRAWDCASA
jgi:hypothetical protein